MEFKQLAISEFHQDVISDYNITCSGFYMALLGSTTEITALELCFSQVPCENFPYSINKVTIPKERPCSKVIEDVELSQIYIKCSVQESQELALDPVYVAEYSSDPPKAKVQQLAWAPFNSFHPQRLPIMALLTTYGACQFRVLDKESFKWNDIVCDINSLYLHQVFPYKASSKPKLNDFQSLKDIVSLHWITAIAWHPLNVIFYTANAAGWIVGFHYDESYQMQEYFRIQTKLSRITYLHAFDDFLLVGNVVGMVKLFRLTHTKINDDSDGVAAPNMTEVECLWSKPDRMSCRKAEITHLRNSNCYYVIFSKAAHVLAYRLNAEGSLLSSCTLYVGGAKITGIATVSSNEFIVVTVMGSVKLIRLDINEHNEMQINEKIITTPFDIKNYQLLGLATSSNRSLFSFMLSRKRDYIHHSNYVATTTFVSIGKLITNESLQVLSNLNIRTLNPFMDHVVAVILDIVNNIRQDDYNNYYALQNARFPDELNDPFLQKLQLKLIIVKAQAKYQSDTYKSIKGVTINEMEFLKCCLQTTHIICTIQQLQRNIDRHINGTPTSFQSLAGSCLRRKFHLLIRELHSQANDENLLKDTIERYIQLATVTFKKLQSNYDIKEKCVLCEALVAETSMLCPQEHKTTRCSISFVQVPLFNSRHCVHCNEVALDNDHQLLEILGSVEELKCTFCRFTFIKDII